eukprot:g30377.t1
MASEVDIVVVGGGVAGLAAAVTLAKKKLKVMLLEILGLEEVSAAALVRFFRRLVGRSSMEMGFAGCGLGELLLPAKPLLESMGAQVRTSCQVRGFLGDENNCTGVVLDSGEEILAKLGVISTLPPQTLQPMLPEAWLSAWPSLKDMEALKPCKYISVYIWFDRKVSGGRQMWARTYNKDDLNCEFYDFSEIYSGTDAAGKLWKERPSFIGSNIIDSGRLQEMTDDEVVQQTLREIQETFPVASDAKVLHSVVNRIPMAIHRPVVGTEKLRPSQQTPIADFYISGCWTRTDFPCSMESAARSGFLAADKLLRIGRGELSESAIPYPDIALSARLVGALEVVRPWLLTPLFNWLVRWSSGQPQSKL